jgi:hypothetical protein
LLDKTIYLNKCDGFIELFLYDTTEINYPKRKNFILQKFFF